MRYHDSAFGNGSKLPSGELIDKVTKSIVIFFLALHILNRKLKLTFYFSHKNIVDHDVVGRVIQFVLDPDNPETVVHERTTIHEVHSLQNTDEGVLVALEF